MDTKNFPAPFRTWRWIILACLLVLPGFASLSAHVMPQTAVMLDFHTDGVAAELILPLQDLGFAVKEPLVAEQDEAMKKYGPGLKDYVLRHVHPTAPDGRAWNVEISDMFIKPGERTPDLTVYLWVRPPAGAPLRRFTFGYDVIVREVVSHKSFVFIRNDWNSARFHPTDQVPPLLEAVGLIRYLVYAVPIDRTQGNWWQGFKVMLKLGIHHVAEGTDHLLFLLVLLLPAPLLAAGRHWEPYAGSRRSLWQLAKIVTVFTVAHAVALALAATYLRRLTPHPVEVLIAVLIFVSAVHALRPSSRGANRGSPQVSDWFTAWPLRIRLWASDFRRGI